MKLEDYWEKNLRNLFLLWIWWFKIIPMIELIFVDIWDFHVIVCVEKRFWLNHYRSKNSWFGDWILVELVVLHVRNRYFVFCIVYLKRLTVYNEGDWERRGGHLSSSKHVYSVARYQYIVKLPWAICKTLT